MKRLFLILALLFAAPSYAQTPVITQPYRITSTNASGSIAVTNTFQSVFAATTSTNRGRAACTIINYGTHTMYVFFGPIASATLTNSVKLSPNQPVYCGGGGSALQDQVSITGTATEAFFAAQQ